MRTIARVLGYICLATAGIWGLVAVASLLGADPDGQSALLGSIVLGLISAGPGVLLLHWARSLDRRQRAEDLIVHREQFSIEEVSGVLQTSMEEAHAFIAEVVRRRGLGLVYREQGKRYLRRSAAGDLPPPPPPPVANVAGGPCGSCGAVVAQGVQFCPVCGSRMEERSADARTRV
jgi:hypothetical protein